MKSFYIVSLFLSSSLTYGLASESLEQKLENADSSNFEKKFTPDPHFYGKRAEFPKVQQSTSAFCTKAINRLKAGPEIIASVIANGTNYTDTSFTGPDMVYWNGDTVTTPSSTAVANSINTGAYMF